MIVSHDDSGDQNEYSVNADGGSKIQVLLIYDIKLSLHDSDGGKSVISDAVVTDGDEGCDSEEAPLMASR